VGLVWQGIRPSQDLCLCQHRAMLQDDHGCESAPWAGFESGISVFKQNKTASRRTTSALSVCTRVHERGSRRSRLEWMQTDDWIVEITSERDLRCGSTWRERYRNKHGSSFRMTDQPYAPINCRPHTLYCVSQAALVPPMLVFWIVTPCGHIGNTILSPEDGCSMFLRNAAICLQDHTAL
jgi:hypothetical protein